MKTFSLELLSFRTLDELPDSWHNPDYQSLLQAMAYQQAEEIADSELKAMCLMCFTDLEPPQAAAITLGHLFADRLSEGQIENLSHQMLTEKLWEEYPDLSLHQGFFKATQLLHSAYNGTFPRAQAVQFQVKLTAEQAVDLSLFDASPAAPLLRLLAQGMLPHALLNRLFSEQLAGDAFAEAEHILWQWTTLEKGERHRVFDLVSSAYWLEEFKYAESYRAPTHADRLAEQQG